MNGPAAANGVHPPKRVLIAEDDEDDFCVLKDALSASTPDIEIEWVKNGEELMQALRTQPHPRLILLDLNMPRMDGREALIGIKADPSLKHIPIVVLTTSTSGLDVLETYRLGVSTYLNKPLNFSMLTESAKVLSRYWFGIATLPGPVH